MNKAEQCKAYIREKGWAKSSMQQPDGKVCMLGAVICSEVEDLMSAEANEVWTRHVNGVIKILGDIAEEQFPERTKILDATKDLYSHIRVSAFNDHPDTTLEDVETVFEKASVRLDELV